MLTYLNHAALNAGEGLLHLWWFSTNLVHAVIPPQLNHDAEALQTLADSSPWREFLIGRGVRER
jgi:hypothetical protein